MNEATLSSIDYCPHHKFWIHSETGEIILVSGFGHHGKVVQASMNKFGLTSADLPKTSERYNAEWFESGPYVGAAIDKGWMRCLYDGIVLYVEGEENKDCKDTIIELCSRLSENVVVEIDWIANGRLSHSQQTLAGKVVSGDDPILEASLGRVMTHILGAGVKSFAILTSWRSSLPLSVNKKNFEAFKVMIRMLNLGFVPVKGKWKDAETGEIVSEPSLLIPGCSKAQAHRWGNLFDQDAVVYAGPEFGSSAGIINKDGSSFTFAKVKANTEMGDVYSMIKGKTFAFEGVQRSSFRSIVEVTLNEVVDQRNLFISPEGERHTWGGSGGAKWYGDKWDPTGHHGYSQAHLGQYSTNPKRGMSWGEKPNPAAKDDPDADDKVYGDYYNFGEDYIELLKKGWIRITTSFGDGIVIDCPNLEPSTLDRVYDWSQWAASVGKGVRVDLFVRGKQKIVTKMQKIRDYNFEMNDDY